MTNKLNNELVEIMIENPAYDVLFLTYTSPVQEGGDFDMIGHSLDRIEVDHDEKEIHVYLD